MTVWESLRQATAARIGLRRAGGSLATEATLAFRLAHARARDAVHDVLDGPALAEALGALLVRSQAPDRRTYLMRPDLGRTLDPADAAALSQRAGAFDLAIVVGDGLSAQAAARHAPDLLAALRPKLAGWSLAPPVVALGARVALGDGVAQALGARAVLMLLGERPGLSAPDSLGAYLTWAPRAETRDSDRNCVSNIRSEGLKVADAAALLAYLLGRMRELQLTGVALKDDSPRYSVKQESKTDRIESN